VAEGGLEDLGQLTTIPGSAPRLASFAERPKRREERNAREVKGKKGGDGYSRIVPRGKEPVGSYASRGLVDEKRAARSEPGRHRRSGMGERGGTGQPVSLGCSNGSTKQGRREALCSQQTGSKWVTKKRKEEGKKKKSK